jgi:hypothetical protein
LLNGRLTLVVRHNDPKWVKIIANNTKRVVYSFNVVEWFEKVSGEDGLFKGVTNNFLVRALTEGQLILNDYKGKIAFYSKRLMRYYFKQEEQGFVPQRKIYEMAEGVYLEFDSIRRKMEIRQFSNKGDFSQIARPLFKSNNVEIETELAVLNYESFGESKQFRFNRVMNGLLGACDLASEAGNQRLSHFISYELFRNVGDKKSVIKIYLKKIDEIHAGPPVELFASTVFLDSPVVVSFLAGMTKVNDFLTAIKICKNYIGLLEKIEHKKNLHIFKILFENFDEFNQIPKSDLLNKVTTIENVSDYQFIFDHCTNNIILRFIQVDEDQLQTKIFEQKLAV